MRVRLHCARDMYGKLAWGFEVYNPERRANRQVLVGGAWYPSWDAARLRGLSCLHDLARQGRC